MVDFETGAYVPGESPEQIKVRIAKLEAGYASKKAEVDKLNAWLSDCEERINTLKAAIGEPEENNSDEEQVGEQTEDEHFGEEQAEGLDSLLAGLKDGPKDERW